MAVIKYLLTQYNLKAGLRHFGEKGIAAAKGELTQLHVMDTWVPEDPTMMSRAEKVKGEEERESKRKGVRERSTSESLHPQRGRIFTNCGK